MKILLDDGAVFYSGDETSVDDIVHQLILVGSPSRLLPSDDGVHYTKDIVKYYSIVRQFCKQTNTKCLF